MTELRIDPERKAVFQDDVTGLYVRAKNDTGSWESVDIAVLDKGSLQGWLRSRGGENEWAENVVLLLLGHEV